MAASDSLPAVESPVPSAGHAASWRLSIDPYLPWLVALWAAGVLVLSVRLAGGWLKVERLKRTGVHAAPAWVADKAAALVARLLVTRPVRVLQSTIARTPVVIGWLRPVVLLPAASLVDLTPAQLEAVIAHELAHVRRCDYLVNLIQTALETLLFYHPCVWWVSSRIRAERENCCDDVAVAVCGDSASYVHALARIAQTAAAAMPLAPAARGGVLLERVSRLLGANPSHERRVTGWLAVPIVAAFAVAAVVLALPKAPLADGAVAIEAKHQEPDSPVPAVDSTGEAPHAAVPGPAPTPSTDAAISAPAATVSQVYDFANLAPPTARSGPISPPAPAMTSPAAPPTCPPRGEGVPPQSGPPAARPRHRGEGDKRVRPRLRLAPLPLQGRQQLLRGRPQADARGGLAQVPGPLHGHPAPPRRGPRLLEDATYSRPRWRGRSPR